MYRPGGFHEFNPQQQAVFDAILDTITTVFRQYHYEHIRTPAVESVDILKKGGDIIDKQVYGLFGLAQGVEDVKDYALHFDLTVPLARYILDHRNDLSFPFRRYQMQPVRRGERTKRGRFKEFWQFDVDVVRPSEMNVGMRYDTETVAVLSRAMEAVCKKFAITIDAVLKISHIGLTKAFLQGAGVEEEAMNKILNLLDGYYKVTHEEFTEKLNAVAPKEVAEMIQKLIATKDHTLLKEYENYAALDAILTGLKELAVPYEYDICIVRGHNYYKGMVCEWFDRADIALGSLAGGGRYDNITDFIDPKQSFSGVGTSLGRFVYLAIEKIGLIPSGEGYLFMHFEDTYTDVVSLYGKFLKEGKICEMYPTAAKLGKQFEYADKKGLSHVVILGGSEKEAGTYKIKNLATGDETTHTLSS